MQVPRNISIDIYKMFFIACVLLFLSVWLFFSKKLVITKRDLIKIIIIWIIFVAFSLIFYTRFPSGEGMLYEYGLPHYYYFTWDSFVTNGLSKMEQHKEGFRFDYFISNVVFWLISSIFSYTLLKKGREN